MKKITFTNETIKEFEKQAWHGTLDYNAFPAAEYKYFDTVWKLGRRHHLEEYPLDFCRADMDKARKEYAREREKLETGLKAYGGYQAALKASAVLRGGINKATSEHEALMLALQALELVTGEEGFAKRVMKGFEK